MSTSATIASNRPDMPDALPGLGRGHHGPWSRAPRRIGAPTRDVLRIPTVPRWSAAIAVGFVLLPIAVAAAVFLLPCALLALLMGPAALVGLATSARSDAAYDGYGRGLPSLVDLLPDLAARPRRTGTSSALASTLIP